MTSAALADDDFATRPTEPPPPAPTTIPAPPREYIEYPTVECTCCRGSGRAQYGMDDSGVPCGPTFACSECDGSGEVIAPDWLLQP